MATGPHDEEQRARDVSAVARTVMVDGTEATIASAPGARVTPGAPTAFEQGATIGRYVTLTTLGAGGMGVVYAAFDPELDRKVALKLVLAEVGGGTRGSEGQSRLLREAQALARLNHPNVVTVHDVGTMDERVWIAMEFVEGRTLDAWARERPRSWREVVALMTSAGAGLAAAHAADLLHRDFKPENVMIGAVDGRPRVMDFGLARARDGATTPGEAAQVGIKSIDTGALSIELTQAGSLLGTPAYMAPEQFLRMDVTAASDQFSFCVTLWELLYGERPFAGSTLVELSIAVCEGAVRPPPRGRRVPAWLRRVCARGLAVEPGERYPSMTALLEALAAGQSRQRLRRVAAVGLTLSTAAGGAALYQRVDERRDAAACVAAGDQITEIWNDDARARVRDGLIASNLSYARTTAERTLPWLDDYARAWSTAQTEVCMDARVRGVTNDDLLERATWCLDTRRAELAALVDGLERADQALVRNAVDAAAGLSPVEACTNGEALRRDALPPANARDDVRVVMDLLSRANALVLSREFKEGLALAERARARAQELGQSALEIRATRLAGTFAMKLGDTPKSATLLREAYFAAANAGVKLDEANAAKGMVLVVGLDLARHEDGLLWGRLARVALEQLGDAAPTMAHAWLDANLGSVHTAMGDYAEARRVLGHALEMGERTLGPEHPSLVILLNALAQVNGRINEHKAELALLERALSIERGAFGDDHPAIGDTLTLLATAAARSGDPDKSIRLSEQALALHERALGPNHPIVANTLHNLGNAYIRKGDYAHAGPLLERALSIREKVLGPEHPELALTLNSLAQVHDAAGDSARAQAELERAIKIQEASLGPKHDRLAVTLSSLASLRRRQGAREESRALYERALMIQEKALGPEHPQLAVKLIGYGNLLGELERYEDARASFDRAITIVEKTYGKSHPLLVYALPGLATVEVEAGRPALAVPLAERALAIADDATPPAQLATVQLVLAQALWALGEQRTRARTLEATAVATATAENNKELLDEIDAWRRTRR